MRIKEPKNQNYAAIVVEIKTIIPLEKCDNVQGANEIGTSSAVICDTLSEKSRRKTINNRMFKRIKKEELEQYRYLIEYDKNKR